ncbi:MAG: asparagine--tRNA ligase, partial [Clostridia bacterium]|nr:asparagine--tRNA ligase [Clostridia bacterium]
MKRIEIRDLHKSFKSYENQIIKLCGWARTVRDSKNIAFIELNDGAFKSVQIVVERDKVSNYDEIVKQNVGSSFMVEGTLLV